MTKPLRAPGDRFPLLITVGLFAALLLCIPLVLMTDDRVDSDRPMYKNVDRMLVLQTSYVATGQPVIETRLSEGASVVIGDTTFTTSDGVTLSVVATEGDDFCVSARNQAGTTTERCSE